MWTPFAQRCSIWIEETLGDAGGGNLAQVTTLCENEAYGRYRPGRTHTNHGRCGDGDWQQYLTGPQPRISYVNLSSRRLSVISLYRDRAGPGVLRRLQVPRGPDGRDLAHDIGPAGRPALLRPAVRRPVRADVSTPKPHPQIILLRHGCVGKGRGFPLARSEG